MKNYDKQMGEPNQPRMILHEIKKGGDLPTSTTLKFDYSLLRAQVNEIIEQGLNDMWLLIDGEEMEMGYQKGFWRDGRAFAMVHGDQVALLGSKFSAVNALLSVGIALH